jgi:hypothetical protein
MAELTDVELLSRLEVVLAPPRVSPDEKTMAQLHATLGELALEKEPVNIQSAVRPRAQNVARARRRRFRTRSSVLVAGAVSLALTAGVAAAAVVTNTLPGPTRAIAYDLGLPVTSPSLFRAQQIAKQLQQSIDAQDRAQEKRLAQSLLGALKTLNASDFSQIRSTADKLLTEVGLGLPVPPNSGTKSVTSTQDVPSVSVPSQIVPGGIGPTVTTPTVTTPSVTVPTVTVPPTTIPTVTVPSVTVPSVTIPKVTVPTLKLPAVP